ncbi:sigma factor-like helix-turn-helix DNA-binding protein [Halobacillus sp. H74]|uniref:sigma factor-like helix-turn-helix DNA-binding protein n=1 Tax=Halobacillus sp. H74 TaxID=3457436 RepID=UPI003FCC4E23
MDVTSSTVNHTLSVEEKVREDYLKLLRYCLFLTKDAWEGKDLAQESFSKALEKYEWSEIQPALLKKISYHCWVDQKRKQEKETLVSSPHLSGHTKNRVHDNSEIIERIVGRLSDKQLVSFVLKEAFQYKISEIAELLEMTDTGVKALLKRARTNVKDITEIERLQVLRTRPEEDLLYETVIQTLTVQDPALLIEKLPILLQPFRSTHRPSSPSNILSLAA